MYVAQSFTQPARAINPMSCFFRTDTLPLLGLQLFEEVAGVLGPEILFKSKAGYNDYQRETQTPQEVQDHMEDKQMKVTGCKKLVQ